MTISDLRTAIANHAPGSMIPRDWILEELTKAAGEVTSVDAWVDTHRAVEITGLEAETLRSRATTWRGMPNPPIRVTKNDPAKLRSPWLFAEEDCWAFARRHGGARPQASGAPRDPDSDPDDAGAIAEHYLDRIRVGL